MKTTFKNKLLGMGNNTGIEVPEANIKELDSGKKPAVTVDVNGYTYSSTVAVMGGKYLIAFNAAHRKASGLNANDDITVTLTLETAPRTVDVPDDLARALEQSQVRAAFDQLAPSKRKEAVRQLEEAKTQDTRARRLQKILESFRNA
ncbi:MAG: DUF1905 domain-containing protein [Pleurocapsa sp. SU_196_0]|nr:DUF1905 domain-containing protein [Pleurocapsa sp. SU_196_0]